MAISINGEGVTRMYLLLVLLYHSIALADDVEDSAEQSVNYGGQPHGCR